VRPQWVRTQPVDGSTRSWRDGRFGPFMVFVRNHKERREQLAPLRVHATTATAGGVIDLDGLA
jgi:hypothetical protein